MKMIDIEETFNSPRIVFVKDENLMLIEGRIIPEDPEILFNQMTDFLTSYKESEMTGLILRFHLFYYNTASGKRLLNFIKYADQLNKEANKEIRVEWICDEGDEDTIEDGEDYQTFVDLDFRIIEVEDED